MDLGNYTHLQPPLRKTAVWRPVFILLYPVTISQILNYFFH